MGPAPSRSGEFVTVNGGYRPAVSGSTPAAVRDHPQEADMGSKTTTADPLAAEIATQAGAIESSLKALQEHAGDAPVMARAELAVELRKVAAKVERVARRAGTGRAKG
jgi:hypothetical protein